MKKFKQSAFAVALMAMLGSAHAAPTLFTPGQLAVLQFGTGGTNRCLPAGAVTGITNYQADDIAGSRQTQLFIDQFDPNGVMQTVPSVQVPIPTNDATSGGTAMLINGNAGTEGCMTLAADKSVLNFAGYQGTLLSITTGGQTAPSNLSYDRGIGTVDAFGNYANPYRGAGWYGIATGKTNPRGVATDGLGNFWGCGNGYGSLYYSAVNTPDGPLQFQDINLTSFSKICNNTLYASVKSGDVQNGLYPAGIYTFVDFYNNPIAYPEAISYLQLQIPANPAYVNCIGFDINPANTIAYVADNVLGIQKYVKVGSSWQIAYNLAIPGYTAANNGIRTNAASTQVLVGAFSVTVDWSGTNPVIYATTSDCGNDSKDPYYGNRVIRINDTNTVVLGTNYIIATTNILTTVAFPPTDAWGKVTTNIVYKSVTFTPDLRPTITADPASWSAYVGDNVSFSVTATAPAISTFIHYQWFQNGTIMPSETSAALTLNSVALGFNGYTYKCAVSDDFGSVTSVVTTLTVSLSPSGPSWGSVQNLTNIVGNNATITASVAGTDPKGGYQWYFGGSPLVDGSHYAGTQTRSLTIINGQPADNGFYSLFATNNFGSFSNNVANLANVYALPVFIQPPSPSVTFLGHNYTNTASVYGQAISGYQWYSSKANGTGPVALSDTGVYSGTQTSSLGITGANSASGTNYVLVVSNPAGSITSAPVALTVLAAPPHTFVSYSSIGQAYVQNFNSLPIPYGSSLAGDNPQNAQFIVTNLTVMLTNGNPGVTANTSVAYIYSLDNPVDFGYPILTNGFIGGLGLGSKMSGWYGWCQNSMEFGATFGDQSQGCIMDNGGDYYADGRSLAGITNRALGLIATTKTGQNAIGVALVNNTGTTLNTINLSFLGELWRNNPNAQPMYFGYFIDPAGTNSTFHPDLWSATNGIVAVNSLNFVFPTTATTTINDGTQASNQIPVSASGLVITNWPPNATLWLVWQAQTLGSAQNVAIDNVNLQAFPATITQPVLSGVSYSAGTGGGGSAGSSAQFSFANMAGASSQFTIWGSTNLALPFPSQWQNLGHPTENPPGIYNVIDSSATNPQEFYKVTSP